jgi:hypothetical protein
VSDGEWVAFLGGNTIVALVLIGVDLLLLRVTRRERWSRGGLAVAIGVGVVGATLFVIPVLSHPADVAAWIWAWSIPMSAALGFGTFLLLPSAVLAAFATLVRLRRPVG